MDQDNKKFHEITNRASEGVRNSRKVDVDRDAFECLVLAKEPDSIFGEVFPEFLMSCVKSGASDITLQSDQQPRVEIQGVWYKATRNPWSPSEVSNILKDVYNSSGPALISSKEVIDFSYQLNLVDGGKQRFRVNATGIHARDGKGMEITFRVLPSEIPTLSMIEGTWSNLETVSDDSGESDDQGNSVIVDRTISDGAGSSEDMLRKDEPAEAKRMKSDRLVIRSTREATGLENEFVDGEPAVSNFTNIVNAMRPQNGLVIVAGAVGSGKSTTLAAVIRTHLEDRKHPVKIVDIQAPIKYVFHDVAGGCGSSSMIGQSEVDPEGPGHIKSFAVGVRSALRRKPGIINVGEARDFETISVTLEAALTGHLVYTTTHANDVSDTIRRLLWAFPADERDARSLELILSLRFCMVQYLIPRIDKPGVIPVREFLRFTQRLKEKLVKVPNSDWPAILADEVVGRVENTGSEDMRQSLFEAVKPLYRQGVIDYNHALRVLGESTASVDLKRPS